MSYKETGTQLSIGGVLENIRMYSNAGAGIQFSKGDACKFTNGLLQQITSQTDKVTHVFLWLIPPRSVMRPATANLTTSADEYGEVIPVSNTTLIFETQLQGVAVPLINTVAVNSGTTTTALITYNGTTGANDFQGGVIYFPTRKTHCNITTSSYGAGVHTITFEPPLPTAANSTDTAIVIPFGVGGSPKFNATTMEKYISVAVADKTGGNVVITSVDLSLTPPVVRLRFL